MKIIINNKLIFTYLFLGISFAIMINCVSAGGAEPISNFLSLLFFCNLPFIVTIVTKLIFCKSKKKVFINIKNILKILTLIVSIIYFFLLLLFFLIALSLRLEERERIKSTNSHSHFATYHPFKEDYPIEYKLLSNKQYRISHFPRKIPDNAQNYFFEVDADPHGFCIHHLKFNIDQNYINKILDNNKNNIYEKFNYSLLDEKYKYLNLKLDITDKANYDIYILKHFNNDNTYTSGFVVSMKHNLIIFFFANFNLKL